MKESMAEKFAEPNNSIKRYPTTSLSTRSCLKQEWILLEEETSAPQKLPKANSPLLENSSKTLSILKDLKQYPAVSGLSFCFVLVPLFLAVNLFAYSFIFLRSLCGSLSNTKMSICRIMHWQQQHKTMQSAARMFPSSISIFSSRLHVVGREDEEEGDHGSHFLVRNKFLAMVGGYYYV